MQNEQQEPWHQTKPTSLSRAQCPRKSNLQATLTAMQSPGRTCRSNLQSFFPLQMHAPTLAQKEWWGTALPVSCLKLPCWACFRSQENKRNQINFRSQSSWPLGITCYNQTNLQGLQPSLPAASPGWLQVISWDSEKRKHHLGLCNSSPESNPTSEASSNNSQVCVS